MKYENPIMNISMFEEENVLTVSGVDAANAAADEAIAHAAGPAKKITIIF